MHQNKTQFLKQGQKQTSSSFQSSTLTHIFYVVYIYLASHNSASPIRMARILHRGLCGHIPLPILKDSDFSGLYTIASVCPHGLQCKMEAYVSNSCSIYMLILRVLL